MCRKMLFSSIILLFISLNFANSYKILGIFAFPGKSHYAAFDPLMVELAHRGHNVTIYDTFPKPYAIPNYHEIDISNCFKLPSGARGIDHMIGTSDNLIKSIHMIFDFIPRAEEISNCGTLLELWNTKEKYDVLITEGFNTDIFLLFAEKLNIPKITFSSNVAMPWHTEQMGSPNNPSYIQTQYSGYTPKMEFFERLHNFVMHYYGVIAYKYLSTDIFNEIAQRIFGSSISKLEDIASKIDLLFLNCHFSYHWPKPLVPNIIEVGGLNIKPSKPLPENIEKFINESKHGVVYFCMGSLLRGETFPPEKREAFLYAFSKIPQRVLWKWEGDVLPGKSDNIMISKWMPQRDILAHPNVKLFISHGGLLGTSEAVYEGVPVLGIPIFGDQRTNIKSLEANGAGELLDYNEISKEVVLEKIQRLLNDPKYKENAKLLSDRYRDRPMSPLDTAVYWTEYVIRHKGAPHLRTAAADMPWYQYLLLDVIAFIVAVLVAGLLIIYYTTKFILRAIYGLICGGGAKKGSSKSDKKKRN
ncbi:UDP-glycosyltransferase UGT5-like isoform X17 [Planococcus citri]|uniref:UDP-glycosyltransferase UGT5-like isoform X17 n=1 Tax=Planococcus citri TaxID=170843 RepID=UPI0031F85512